MVHEHHPRRFELERLKVHAAGVSQAGDHVPPLVQLSAEATSRRQKHVRDDKVHDKHDDT